MLILVLPEFGGEQRLEAYNGVVRDALAEAYVNAASSLEDQVRLSGYRRSLERLLRLQQQLGGDAPAARPGRAWKKALDHGPLGRRFSISGSEEADARETLDPASGDLRRGTLLRDRLEPLLQRLHQLAPEGLQSTPSIECRSTRGNAAMASSDKGLAPDKPWQLTTAADNMQPAGINN